MTSVLEEVEADHVRREHACEWRRHTRALGGAEGGKGEVVSPCSSSFLYGTTLHTSGDGKGVCRKSETMQLLVVVWAVAERPKRSRDEPAAAPSMEPRRMAGRRRRW